jgi:hypothetical protein
MSIAHDKGSAWRRLLRKLGAPLLEPLDEVGSVGPVVEVDCPGVERLGRQWFAAADSQGGQALQAEGGFDGDALLRGPGQIDDDGGGPAGDEKPPIRRDTGAANMIRGRLTSRAR